MSETKDGPTLIIPEGHILVPHPYKTGWSWRHDEEGLRPDEALRFVVDDPDTVRVVPIALFEERKAMRKRHQDEENAFAKRIIESPRFDVTISLVVQ